MKWDIDRTHKYIYFPCGDGRGQIALPEACFDCADIKEDLEEYSTCPHCGHLYVNGTHECVCAQLIEHGHVKRKEDFKEFWDIHFKKTWEDWKCEN